jgi:hypothetical protein
VRVAADTVPGPTLASEGEMADAGPGLPEEGVALESMLPVRGETDLRRV